MIVDSTDYSLDRQAVNSVPRLLSGSPLATISSHRRWCLSADAGSWQLGLRVAGSAQRVCIWNETPHSLPRPPAAELSVTGVHE